MSENKISKTFDLDLTRNNSKSVESPIQLNLVKIGYDFVHIDLIPKNSPQKSFNLLNEGEKIKFAPKNAKNSEATTATNASINNFILNEEVKKEEPLMNFINFINPNITNQDILDKKIRIKATQLKFKYLDDLEKEDSYDEDIHDLDYSFLSNSDSEFLQISSCEELSDFELRELEEDGILDDMNKSYIDMNILNVHKAETDLEKVIFSYTRLKSLLNQDLISINLYKMAKLKTFISK
jgi:hypothetical protein